jgi:hypothetical protein
VKCFEALKPDSEEASEKNSNLDSRILITSRWQEENNQN